MRLPRHWTPASGHSARRWLHRLSKKKKAKQRGAQGAPLPHPNLGCATGSRAPADPHAHGSASEQRPYGCQHLAMHSLSLQRCPEQWVLHAVIGLLEIHNGLQLAPQHVMLDSIICFLQVHEAGIEGALSEAERQRANREWTISLLVAGMHDLCSI